MHLNLDTPSNRINIIRWILNKCYLLQSSLLPNFLIIPSCDQYIQNSNFIRHILQGTEGFLRYRENLLHRMDSKGSKNLTKYVYGVVYQSITDKVV